MSGLVFRNSCPHRQPGHALPLLRAHDRAEASDYPSGATETLCTRRFAPSPTFWLASAEFREFPSLAEVPDGPP